MGDIRMWIEIDADDARALELLIGQADHHVASTIGDLGWYLLHCAADGVRRPGSWERNWIIQATGAEF